MNLKERINQNINDAYVDYGDFRTYLAEDYLLETCKDFALSFSLFCAENYVYNRKDDNYRVFGKDKTHTIKELLTLYLEDGTNTPL